LSIKLLVFPHSHYCEKARWALDFKGIDYQVRVIMPWFHVRTLKKYTDVSTVPVLLNGETVVQGSSKIIDYLETQHPAHLLSPLDRYELRECLVGDRFSRADLSVSSMLSLLVMPEQHPFPWPAIPDPQLQKFIHSYHRHPVYKWAQKIYSRHR